jgi:hypothetical protein
MRGDGQDRRYTGNKRKFNSNLVTKYSHRTTYTEKQILYEIMTGYQNYYFYLLITSEGKYWQMFIHFISILYVKVLLIFDFGIPVIRTEEILFFSFLFSSFYVRENLCSKIILYCDALYCTVQYRSVLYCTAPYRTPVQKFSFSSRDLFYLSFFLFFHFHFPLPILRSDEVLHKNNYLERKIYLYSNKEYFRILSCPSCTIIFFTPL